MAVSIIGACAGSSFTGTGARTPAVTTTPTGSGTGGSPTGTGTGTTTGDATTGLTTGGATESGTPEIPEDCTSSGVTQANLLTKDLTNYAVNVVDYEIYLTDCDGNLKTLTSDFISFDVDAMAAGIGKGIGIAYEISDAKTGAALSSGILSEVSGSDLFGNTGSQYFHYQSSQAVSVTSGSKSFKLRIHLPAACCTKPLATDAAADQLVDSYLKLGKAAPVKKVVLFKAATPPASVQ